MTSRVLERRANRFLPGALIASVVVLACSGPSENDFFGDDPPGTGGTGGSMAGTSGSSNAGSSGKGGSAGSETGGTAGTETGGTAGTETTGGSAGTQTGGTAGSGTGGTAGSETGGTAGTETAGTAGAGSGGIAGSTAGTTGTDAGAGGMNEAGAGGTPPTCVPEDERCDGIDNDCEDGADDGSVCPDGCVGAHFEGHDYLFCHEDNSGPLGGGRAWGQSRTACVMEAKVLVHLETESEAKFVYAKLAALDLGLDAWMGATDRAEDEWMWEGTTMLDTVQFYDHDTEMAVDGYFIDWREGEPNDGGGEDCGVIEDQGDGTYLWDDRSCTEELELYVCEGEP